MYTSYIIEKGWKIFKERRLMEKNLLLPMFRFYEAVLTEQWDLEKVQKPAQEPPLLEDGLVSKLCTACFEVVGKFL